MVKKQSLGRALRKKSHPTRTSQKNAPTQLGTDAPFPTKSVTEENSLTEFFNIARLANADFTAQKKTFRFLSKDEVSGIPSSNSYLKIASAQKAYVDLLKIPKRPQWNQSMSAADLNRLENEEFLKWRRALAELEVTEHVVLTPFEKNIEFWRQLWRVVERSDILVQIVDARQPLLYYCVDLDRYARDVNADKICVLLVNKADFLTERQRYLWHKYFKSQSIRAVFWSATLAAQSISKTTELPPPSDLSANQSDSGDSDSTTIADGESESAAVSEERIPSSDERSDTEECQGSAQRDPIAPESDVGNENSDSDLAPTEIQEAVRLLSSTELLDFLTNLYPQDRPRLHQAHLTVGFVGYPNVGKSSTLNALVGSKKTAVSITPGRTKHFQTLHVRPDLVLCDCPGLVMPSFAHSRADLVVAGILSVDELRDFLTPIGLVCQQIPRRVLELTYGIDLSKPKPTCVRADVGDKPPTPHELLAAHALSRSFMTAKGNPHYDRSARIILKDYIQGRLLYCHPPPDVDPVSYQLLGRASPPIPGRVERRKQVGAELTQDKGRENSELIDEFDKLAFSTDSVSFHPHLRNRKLLLRPPTAPSGDGGDDIIDDAGSTSTWTTLDSSVYSGSWTTASTYADEKRPWRLMSLSKHADLVNPNKPGRSRKRREKLRRVYRHLDQHETT